MKMEFSFSTHDEEESSNSNSDVEMKPSTSELYVLPAKANGVFEPDPDSNTLPLNGSFRDKKYKINLPSSSNAGGGGCCANCNSIHDSANSKKFTELLPMQYFNTTTGEYAPIEIMEAICEIFKIRWARGNIDEVLGKPNLELCNECSRILIQLYRYYTSFTALTVTTKSFLSTIINFDKDLSTVPKKIEIDDSNDCNTKLPINSSVLDDSSCGSTDTVDNLASKNKPNCISDPYQTAQVERKEPENVFEKKLVFPITKGARKCYSQNDTPPKQRGRTLKLILRRLTPAQIKKATTKMKLEENVTILECKECNKEFKFSIQLQIHLNTLSHKEKLAEVANANKIQQNHSRNIPVSEKHGKLPRNNTKETKVNQPRNRMNSGDKKALPIGKIMTSQACAVCGKVFRRIDQFQRHILTHKEGQLQCERCSKKFYTESALKLHYKVHVRDDNKQICKHCGKKFHKLEALQYHEKVDHDGYKPLEYTKCVHIQGDEDTSFGCSQCRRKFTVKGALDTHALVHQHEKAHICGQCNKGFETIGRLKMHEKTHVEKPGCICHICGRMYKHIRDLTLHEVSHQEESTFRFGCGDCNRRFYRIDLLRVHQSNEKHFSSDITGPSPSMNGRQESAESYGFYDLGEINDGSDNADNDDGPEMEDNSFNATPNLKKREEEIQRRSQASESSSHPQGSHVDTNSYPTMVQIPFKDQAGRSSSESLEMISNEPNSGFSRREKPPLATVNLQSHSQNAHLPVDVRTYSHNTQITQLSYLPHSNPHPALNHNPTYSNPAPHYNHVPTIGHSNESRHSRGQYVSPYLIRELGSDRNVSATGNNAPTAGRIGYDVITSFMNILSNISE